MIGCRRCGALDHWEDSCGHNIRAATFKEHLERLDGYKLLFLDEKIGPREKQHMIREENRLWYGKDIPAALNR